MYFPLISIPVYNIFIDIQSQYKVSIVSFVFILGVYTIWTSPYISVRLRNGVKADDPKRRSIKNRGRFFFSVHLDVHVYM